MTGTIMIRIKATDKEREMNHAFAFTNLVQLLFILYKWGKKADILFIYPKK